eukprot:7667959-Pyramimonas_sp.AAC.1
MLGQQQWMQRQMQEAMESMRRDGSDLSHENWTPPWEHAAWRNSVAESSEPAWMHICVLQPPKL